MVNITSHVVTSHTLRVIPFRQLEIRYRPHPLNLGPDVQAALRRIPSLQLQALDGNQIEEHCAYFHGKIIALGVFEQSPDGFWNRSCKLVNEVIVACLAAVSWT